MFVLSLLGLRELALAKEGPVLLVLGLVEGREVLAAVILVLALPLELRLAA